MVRLLPLLLVLACGDASTLEPATDFAGEPGVVGAVAADSKGAREAYAQRTVGTDTEIVVRDDGTERVLVSGGTPDRPVLSADGSQVAFVWGVTGFASIWIVPFTGGDPVQLTNVDLVPTPGHRPAGFVPVPHGDSLHFDGDWLRWTSPEGEHQERWR